DAVALIEEAEFASRGSLSTHAVCLSHLAWACLRAGDDLRGLALAAEAIAELREHHLETYNLATNVPAVHAYAMARQGRRDDHRAAVERVDELLASLGGAVPRAQCQIRLILAESALLLDDADGAAAFLAAAEPFLAAEPDAVVLWDAVDDIRGRLADRARQARAISGYRLTDAELRVLAELPTHRSLEEIGRVLYISRNTVKTHAVSIYRKLGVSGRSAAVERARSLGLIDEVPAGR
ncbi:MAG TPA: LuxR C-terminal-related transcriptional regulator, partial [Acidimicrobiales bacterium]|nr:LuxR C-terminal-related transcriptional regulator [Acidimicrobiales bacterium]